MIIPIVHFNDVYHLDPFAKEPVGGYARFFNVTKSYIDSWTQKNDNGGGIRPFVFFSGDLFNPSLESAVTKGSHMLVVNHMGIDVACYGNHDFDFGVDQLTTLSKKCNFPWLISNVYKKGTRTPLALGKEYLILERGGYTFGIIGLVEEDWLATLAQMPPLDFEDYVARGRELANKLKSGELSNGKGVDFVLALTHMRVPNDKILADSVPEIDLIFGGHDHDWFIYGDNIKHDSEFVWEGSGIRVVKSACDFKDVGFVELDISSNSKPKINSIKVTRQRITSEFAEDPKMLAEIESTTAELKSKLGKAIGVTSIAWDARGVCCRVKESNIGNFAADLMRYAYATDVALIGGGTIRSDSMYGPGEITIKDIMEIFPFDDPCVVIKIKGKYIREALENGVSKVPAMEGRFPQVSGMKFTYDSKLPPLSRVLGVSVLSQLPTGETQFLPLDPEKEYTMCTRGYLANGRDGFDALKQSSSTLVGEHDGMLLSMLIRRFFTGLRVVKIMSQSQDDLPEAAGSDNSSEAEKLESVQKFARKWQSAALKRSDSDYVDDALPVVSPVVEGRIIDVSSVAASPASS